MEIIFGLRCLSTLPQEKARSQRLQLFKTTYYPGREENSVKRIISFVTLKETKRHHSVAITNCGRRVNRSNKTLFIGKTKGVIAQKLCKYQMHVMSN